MRKKKVEKKFIEVYDKHAEAIFRFCYFKLSSKEKAEEITQEAFMKTWEYLCQNKEIENIRAFVYRVAKNSIVDYYRKKKEVSLDELHEQGFDVSKDEHGRLENILDGEQAIQAIQKLDDKYREALFLRYVNDASVKEIAEIIEETENVVSVRIHRGLKQLREMLSPPV